MADSKAKKRKLEPELVVEFAQAEYGGDQGEANALVMSGKKKKKVVKDEDEKIKKPALMRKRIKQQKEAKLSKKKQKALAALAERKKKKTTQAELFESLAAVQLDAKKTKLLQSSSHINDKASTVVLSEEQESQDLTIVAQKIRIAPTIHNKPRVQENYYSTDSESGEEDEVEVKKEEVEDEEEDGDDVQILEDDSEEDDQNAVAMEEVVEGVEVKEEIDSEAEEETQGKKKKKQKKNKETKKSSSSDVPKELKKMFPVLPESRRQPRMVTTRDDELNEKRSELPIFQEEQAIVEAINENVVSVLCGETGSGKTTQIPQFLFEAGYTENGKKLIGITEPRRVAAISMAKRVGEELGMPKTVSYQIRFEGTRNEETEILYMTDGVLMKEMENDVMLKKYSVLIIDEAHERSMYSDVLIGMLSRIAPLRAKTDNPLKLIIMSATLRLADFTHKRLFPTVEPKVLKVESRQFPVSIHFEKRTPTDYMAAAFRKTCRIHEKLPTGAILLFVSGQKEITHLVKKLSERYPFVYETTKTGEVLVKGSKEWHKAKAAESEQKELKLEDFKTQEEKDAKAKEKEDEMNELKFDGEDLLESGIGGDAFDDGLGIDDDEETDSEDESSALPPPPNGTPPLYCLPLYSLLSSDKQKLVFQPPPEGSRMCVIATNVAETSITIPWVRYVVDSGYEKRRQYDPVTGVSQFVVARCSQASADQRAGRAGRVSAGHAYRIYSSQVYSDLEKFSRPEIVDKPADQLVLHLKSMNIVKVTNFPFPSSPDADALEAAESRLVKMGGLARTTKMGKTEARISPLGRSLAVFPLSPAYAKAVAMANQHDLMPYVISLISALSVREPLINVASLRGSTEDETKQRMTDILKLRRGWMGKGPSRRLGDLLVLLRAVTASEECNMSPGQCDILGMRYKAMHEVRKLRTQLTNIVTTTFKADAIMTPELPPPSDRQCQMLRQILVSCLADRIAKRADRSLDDEEVPRGAYRTQLIEEFVFIDTTSMIYTEEPDYVLFQEITQIGDRKCMQCVMNVDEEWIPRLAEAYCRFGESSKDAVVRFDSQKDSLVSAVRVFFGPLEWDLGMVERPLPKNITTYRLFAQFLLAGEIIPGLAHWVPKLIAPPITMTREWARLQPRTEQLLNALVDKEALSRDRLLEVWETDQTFLLDEYEMWLPVSQHEKLKMTWPPVEEEGKK